MTLDIPFWDYRDPFVKIYNDYILISCLPINMAFRRDQREFLEDFLSQHHYGKHIVIRALDGENLENLGFLSFFKHLCKVLEIQPHRVTVISSEPCKEASWQWLSANLTIFWSVDSYLDDARTTEDTAKLFGLSIGRFNPLRHRLLQILHRNFGSDVLIVCNYNEQEVREFYQQATGCAHAETQWMLEQQLSQDFELPNNLRNLGTIPWQIACKSYGALSKQWHVEIVVETDFYTPTWFTEKTSKCLYQGKPFVLVGGPGSLQHLRSMGFLTFNDFIDESYDFEPTFHGRINKICQTLIAIKHHPDQQTLLANLTNRAAQNRFNWNTLKQRHLIKC